MLTGESKPVRPAAGGDVHAGTYVVEGHGAVLVTATGARTRLAEIAAVTEHAARPHSPLANQLNQVVKLIAGIAVGVGVLFFGVSLLLGLELSDGFLFAIGAASGALFAAVVLGQLANAYACRSETRWVGRVGVTGNRLLTYAVGFELVMLAVFLFLPPLPELLGGHAPSALGWGMALLAAPAVLIADGAQKALRARASTRPHR